jgi:hypothetical protein
MLQVKLAQLQARRAQVLSGGGPAIPEPRVCDVLGNAPHTPEAIDQKLIQVEVAKSKLMMDANLPGPVTYEQILPQLRALELQKIQLLKCGITRGSKVKLRIAPSKDAAKAAALYARQSQESLNQVAMQLAEKQAKRREFWDSLGNYDEDVVEEVWLKNEDFRAKLAANDTHWDKDKRELRRDESIDTLEKQVLDNEEASKIYKTNLWDLEHNQPVKKSTFKKIMDVACEYTEPCHSNLEQFHADLESGMSRDDALARGIIRTGIIAIPSETGPGDLIPIEENPFIPPPVVHTEPPVVTEPPVTAKPDLVPQPPPPVRQPAPPVHVEPPATTTPDPVKVPEPPLATAATPKVVPKPKPKPKASAKPTVSPKEKPLKPLPSGENRGTIRVTESGYQTTKPSQPEVIVRRTTGRTPDPAYAVDPYKPSKTNVASEYRFRQSEKNGKTYQREKAAWGCRMKSRHIAIQRRSEGFLEGPATTRAI